MENKGFMYEGSLLQLETRKGSVPSSVSLLLSRCVRCPYVEVEMGAKTWDGAGMSQEDFMIKDEVRCCNNLLSRPSSSQLLYGCAVPVRSQDNIAIAPGITTAVCARAWTERCSVVPLVGSCAWTTHGLANLCSDADRHPDDCGLPARTSMYSEF